MRTFGYIQTYYSSSFLKFGLHHFNGKQIYAFATILQEDGKRFHYE